VQGLKLVPMHQPRVLTMQWMQSSKKLKISK
jgi:hypothetical protein